jgi:LmbE family N-acetylglucosaminyl deacetylase
VFPATDGQAGQGLAGRVAVLSPHLDDAALSLGGSIARASAAGADLRVITVFAYDPESDAPAAPWDAACGFRTAAEAARARRDEDARSCALMGATPVWLPFADVENAGLQKDAEIWSAVAEAVSWADVVLLPGFPLVAPDHLSLTRLCLAEPLPVTRVGLYVEQPYATWRLMSRGGRAGSDGLSSWEGIVNSGRLLLRTSSGRRLQRPQIAPELHGVLPASLGWSAAPYGQAHWRRKRAAIQAHRSQIETMGKLVLARIGAYERAWGGEGLAWLDDAEVDPGERAPEPR